jgi:hypothetical protein
VDKLEVSTFIYALMWVLNVLALKTSTSWMACMLQNNNAVIRTAEDMFLRRFNTQRLVYPELTGISVRHQAYLAVPPDLDAAVHAL